MADYNEYEPEDQPLLYEEALNQMRKLEGQYKIRSEELFSALAQGERTPEIDDDDLFDWRTYFEFAKEVEHRLECFVLDQSIAYSTSAQAASSDKQVDSQDQRVWEYAA
jgi:hypothetical protein